MDLSGAVTLVTGGSEGIGKAIATELVAEGATYGYGYFLRRILRHRRPLMTSP